MIGIDALIEVYVAAGDANDAASLRRVLHPDIVTHSPGGDTVRGVEAQIAAWEAAHRGLDELRHEILAVIASGDSAAVRIRVTGLHTGPFLGIAATGNRIEVDQALFVLVDGDRIVEMWEVVDTGSGLRQLGVLGDQALRPGSPET